MPSRSSASSPASRSSAKHRLRRRGVERAELADQRADEILPPRRHQHAERGEIARQLRNDHPRDGNLAARSHTACSGPAPPNAIIVVSRGSMPRLTDTARTASDMAPSAMVAMPSAASAYRGRAARRPCRRWRFRAPATSSLMPPPRKRSPLSRPSTRSASVTAGSRAAAAVAGRPRIGAGGHRADMEPAALRRPRRSSRRRRRPR